MDCIFCKIIAGALPSRKAYEDGEILAFHDIKPQANTHIIIVPKTHIENADAINAGNSRIIAHIFECIPKIAADSGLERGYRVITNCGEDGAQSVYHLHFHLLGGERLPERVGSPEG